MVSNRVWNGWQVKKMSREKIYREIYTEAHDEMGRTTMYKT